MAAYRPLGQFPQFFLNNGDVNAGGFIKTYESDLTTPKLTYSDEALTVPNPLTISLDSAGRPSVDMWGEDVYGMEVLNSASVVYLTANNIQPDSGSGQAIPALETGEFLTNDGSNLLWEGILQPPDPTGFANYFLSNDGANMLWQPIDIPKPAEPEIVITTTPETTFRAGTSDSTTKYYQQLGTGEAPASGTENTQVSVSFPESFTALWHVNITQTHNGVTALGIVPQLTVTAQSASGFTVRFSTEENSDFAGWSITSPVPFTWQAIGTKVVT